MENSKRVTCWVVITQFSAGIYLYNPEKSGYLKTASIIAVNTYQHARDILSKLSQNTIDYQQFRCNRLYQIKDKRIYTLFYNRKYIVFCKTENCMEFFQRKDLEIRFFRRKNTLDYKSAQREAFRLGAKCKRDSSGVIYPKENVIYERYQGGGFNGIK